MVQSDWCSPGYATYRKPILAAVSLRLTSISLSKLDCSNLSPGFARPSASPGSTWLPASSPSAWHKELRMRISITRPRFYRERRTVTTTVRGRQGVTLAEADISAGRILLGTPRYYAALTSRLVW